MSDPDRKRQVPTGTVPTYEARWVAQDPAETVTAVHPVPNRLRLAHG